DRARLAAQRASLLRSDRLHAQASRAWLGITRDAVQQPALARDTAQGLAAAMVTQLCEDDSSTLRLLSDAVGTCSSQHALNVTTLALMLARHLGLDAEALHTIAIGALLHDIGKLLLPDALRQLGCETDALAHREQREHVAQGLRLGMAMGLDGAVLQIIGQHHENGDGSGLPQGLKAEALSLPARIVALVNRYDRLCNPRHHGQPLRTPQEALAELRTPARHPADAALLAAFVQLLGLYPPGSVVQLSDERIAVVVAVHPAHALRPSVRVYDPRVAPEDAELLHLAQETGLSVQRSLHPQHLPRAMRDYLLPRERIACYFVQGLEPALDPAGPTGSTQGEPLGSAPATQKAAA
ncbi:MAG TPA: HD domain-containing protein, partial [Burkholderiaceae bacterium]|nr:HD domain-containing protein [Burkholderiaceae bacterium]